MKKNHQEELDKLFAQAKQEKPLLSLQEVEKKLHTAPVPRGFVARHWPAIVSGLAIVAAGWMIINSQINQQQPKIQAIELNLSKTYKWPAPKEELPLPKVDINSAALEPKQASKKTLKKQPAATFKDHIEKINYLELQENELEKMGMFLSGDSLKICIRRDSGFVEAVVLKNENSHFSTHLVFYTGEYYDTIKHKPLRLRHINNNEKKGNNLMLKINYTDSVEFDYLVPIRVWGRYQGEPLEWIVWYDLSLELIDALPSRYREELTAELNKSQEGVTREFAEETSCGYFETFCRDISIFDRIRVFPNPATTHMTANFETLEDCQLSVDLMNIEGQLVQNLFNGSISRGVQKIVLDVSTIEPDLYLLKFEASNGEYETMRVIIKR